MSDHFSHALTRINQAGVSAKCKQLARESRELAFNVLGPCHVFWDTDEDSITFESMHHDCAFVVHGDSDVASNAELRDREFKWGALADETKEYEP